MSEDYKKDILYVHMFPREHARYVPNFSPFAVKVETWLRANDIKYQVVETMEKSKLTGQIPYLVYNGKEIPDSDAMISFMAKLKGVEIDEGLTKEQRAVSRAFSRMLDDGTSWTYFLHRYCYEPEKYAPFCQVPDDETFADRLKTYVKDRAEMHGIGRKTVEDVNKIAQDDLQALSDYLADKKFMHGNNLSLVDCGVFGHLSQIVYVPFPFPQMAYIKTNCQNLLSYMDRIRDTCWADWNSMVKSEPFGVYA